MPFMMILLRYRVTVSISDGKPKIDDRYWQSMFTTLSATKVTKNKGAKYSRFYCVKVKDIIRSQLFSRVCRLRTISNQVRGLCFVS